MQFNSFETQILMKSVGANDKYYFLHQGAGSKANLHTGGTVLAAAVFAYRFEFVMQGRHLSFAELGVFG